MITNKWGRVVSLLFIVLIGLLVGCGGDDKPAVENNNSQADAGTKDDTGTSEPVAYRSDYQLRFTSFAFDKGSPGSSLNGVLKQNFDQDKNFPVIILIEMKDLDVSKLSVGVRGGSGVKTDVAGTYKWDPDSNMEALTPGKIAADGELDATLPKLDFIASFEDKDGKPLKTTIPIKGLKLSGHLSAKADGSAPTIEDGILEGYVTLADGDATIILLPLGDVIQEIPLSNVFLKNKLNHSVDGGTNNAWYLKASFTAVETKIVD